MSRAAQCDRCGKCYPLEDLDMQTVKIHDLGVPMDLCNDCYEQLESWLNDKDASILSYDIGKEDEKC